MSALQTNAVTSTGTGLRTSASLGGQNSAQNKGLMVKGTASQGLQTEVRAEACPGGQAAAVRRTRKEPLCAAASCRWLGWPLCGGEVTKPQVHSQVWALVSHCSGKVPIHQSTLSPIPRSPKHLVAVISRRTCCSGEPEMSAFETATRPGASWKSKDTPSHLLIERKDARSRCLFSKQELNVCHFYYLITTQEVC